MKILKYKTFESNEYDDEIRYGFKYSEREIVEFLLELMDNLDFEIETHQVGIPSQEDRLIFPVYLDKEFNDVKGNDSLLKSEWVGYIKYLYTEDLLATQILKYLKERYEGIHGFIIRIDYKSWFNDLIEED